MRRQIVFGKVKHKGVIYESCFCLGDKEIYIHPKGKRTLITDFEIIKDSVISLGYTNSNSGYTEVKKSNEKRNNINGAYE